LPLEAIADPTGGYIAAAMSDGTLWILDAKDGHTLAPPLQANDGFVSISPNGRYIATAGEPPRVTIWDPNVPPGRGPAAAGRQRL
jgi:WD40 repeat protein